MTDDATAVVEELVDALMTAAPHHRALIVAKAWLRRQQGGRIETLPGWVRRKGCFKCGDDIFFAGRKTSVSQTMWVAVCPVPIINDEHVVLDGLTISFETSEPAIAMQTQKGVQWLPHRFMCGIPTRPSDPDLGAIWDLTTGKERWAEVQALERFAGILEDTE